ncbi:MAG: LCP family protein [Chloroflexi bacterium]|nr:LCP family protein [Chloroflexota bacterium]
MPKISFPKFNFKRPTVGGIIFWVIALGLGVATMIAARNFATCWTITKLPGEAPSSCNVASNLPQFNAKGTPIPTQSVDPAATPQVAAPADVAAPTWDGGSRVNVLFIGVDARDWEANVGAPRSDSMILFTIDPVTKTAGMLSIPRDMWVNIPGSGYGRINTAYSIGEGSKLPGGGPGLAMETVEQFLGVPVHYYAQVDFNTFIEMIDTIGGIDVVVKERLILDPVGTGKDKSVLTPGERHLVGWKALAYARTRKTQGGDVDRAGRQQDVIFAIMQKVFSPDYFPTFVKQAPELYARMSVGIHTNLGFEDGLRLAVLLRDVQSKENSIKTGVINYDMVSFAGTTLNGQDASVFKPKPDQIRILRDDIFGGGAVSPLAAGADPVQSAKQEAARIRLTNGSAAPDFGQRTATYLQGLGLNVTELAGGNATDRTVIILYSSKLYTARFILFLFGLNGNSGTSQIKFDPNSASPVDVEIILGNDALNANRIP